MGNICDTGVPVGVNINCAKNQSRITNIVIAPANAKFDSIADFLNLNVWKTKIQVADGFYVPVGLSNSEDTTEDPTINTTPLGDKFVVGETKPSAVVYLKSNPCDYKEILAKLKGGTFGVFAIFEDGSIGGWINSVGEVKPFKASLFSTPSKMHDIANPETAYRVWINYNSVDEHKNRIIQTPAWNPMLELPELMPTGLAMVKTSEVTTGEFDVMVSVRCGDEVAGLLLADFEIVESNNPELEIASVTDNGLGSYTIVVDDGASPTPAPMAAGEYVVIRVKKTTGGAVTDISGNLTVIA